VDVVVVVVVVVEVGVAAVVDAAGRFLHPWLGTVYSTLIGFVI